MNVKQYRLKAKQLRKECSPSLFRFKSTAELQPLRGIIGRTGRWRLYPWAWIWTIRAITYIWPGLLAPAKAAWREMLEERASARPAPSGLVLCLQFQADAPVALRLPPGQGKVFKQDISSSIDSIIKNIVKAFESEEYENKKNSILNAFLKRPTKCTWN